jgi:CxxC motif-containing protein (DUF1111 family)
MRQPRRLCIWIAAWGCAALISASSGSGQAPQVKPGDPLPGLTPAEFSEFRVGLDDFTEVETVDEGLGPAFNATSCAVCHSLPAVGGTSLILETRAAHRSASGEVRALNTAGDTLLHLFSVPTHACQPSMPLDANVVAHRIPVPLFGAGLVEAIPDDTIRSLEDSFDRNGDGVRGRASLVVDIGTGERRVGRFGWKAQHATLLAFAADAYRNEMGITNDLMRQEYAYEISEERMKQCDPIPEPEDRRNPASGRRGIDNFESFMRFLAPISRANVDETIRDGERIFSAIGCTACHVPALTTGPSVNPLFNRRPVPLFSDLLLHDVGTGDGIPQAAAKPEEIRTPALWGLRFRRPLLHDGSAATIEDAIGRHEHEGDLARRGFQQLSTEERQRLLAFLRSL